MLPNPANGGQLKVTTPAVSQETSPAQLRRLYDDAAASGALDGYRRRRWQSAAEFRGWLALEALPRLQPEQAARLYWAAGGRDVAAFQANPIAELRDSLDFLLYDTIKLEGRFDECVAPGGAYRLAGAGQEFASWLLCLREPALFCVWNANAERLLRRAGMYPGAMKQKRGPAGVRYLDLLEAMAHLSARAGLPDFIAADETAWLSARRPKNPLA